MPTDHDRYYCFSEFAMQLNELEEGTEEVLPPTDCRFRPDQRWGLKTRPLSGHTYLRATPICNIIPTIKCLPKFAFCSLSPSHPHPPPGCWRKAKCRKQLPRSTEWNRLNSSLSHHHSHSQPHSPHHTHPLTTAPSHHHTTSTHPPSLPPSQMQREARAERERLGKEWQPNFFMLVVSLVNNASQPHFSNHHTLTLHTITPNHHFHTQLASSLFHATMSYIHPMFMQMHVWFKY